MQNVPNDVHERVVEWIKKHHHVIHSPIAKDTIQVKNCKTVEWERKSKLLLQCSLAELLSNLLLIQIWQKWYVMRMMTS